MTKSTLLLIFSIILFTFFSCATVGKEVVEENSFEQVTTPTIIEIIPEGSFQLESGTYLKPYETLVENGYLYINGSGNMGILKHSQNMAKTNALRSISEYVTNKITADMIAYINETGVNESKVRTIEFTQLLNYTSSNAQFSGAENIAFQNTDDGTVYLLYRIPLKNLKEVVDNKIEDLKKDSTNEETLNFFTHLNMNAFSEN